MADEKKEGYSRFLPIRKIPLSLRCMGGKKVMPARMQGATLCARNDSPQQREKKS